MKTSLIASALLIAAFGAPVFAADADVSPGTYVRDSGTYVKDSAIFVAVKSKLKSEHVDSYSHLQVITDSNGVVLLKGKVRPRLRLIGPWRLPRRPRTSKRSVTSWW